MARLYWGEFLKYIAGQSTAGTIRDLGGMEAAWVNSALIINNATYLTAPVADAVELRGRMEAAAADAAAHGLPWAFYLYEPFAAGIDAEAVAADVQMHMAMDIEVMLADVEELLEPVRPLPEVAFRRIAGREDAAIAMDINLRSYDMPAFMGESVLETNAYYSDPAREWGYLAYVGEVPVSTATVIELDGCLYVALVATDPGHRQKGYAEAVMRHALHCSSAALALTHTALDASRMGAPLYEQMGFRRTGETWSMYMPA